MKFTCHLHIKCTLYNYMRDDYYSWYVMIELKQLKTSYFDSTKKLDNK